MIVGFDVSPLQSAHLSRGVGFYTQNLLGALKDLKELKVIEVTNYKNLLDIDLVHIPFFDFYFRSLPNIKLPAVVTVHDVIPMIFKNHYPAGIKGTINFYFQKRALQRCKGIITVSNNAKEDIVKYLGIPNEKIHVIYSAASEYFKVIKNQKVLKDVSTKFNLPSEFALYVGNVNWNKNILNTARAAIDANIDLVVVGSAFTQKENLDHPELNSFKKFLKLYENHPKIHFLGYVQDKELVALYNLASMTLFVSIYEGFGFPILESQACGTPVITSNCSSMPEVAGDGAIFVNPINSNEITNAIIKLKEDKSLRSDVIKRGFENINRFSWKKTAQDVYKVYKECLKDEK